jgi:hypothetical protein
MEDHNQIKEIREVYIPKTPEYGMKADEWLAAGGKLRIGSYLLYCGDRGPAPGETPEIIAAVGPERYALIDIARGTYDEDTLVISSSGKVIGGMTQEFIVISKKEAARRLMK